MRLLAALLVEEHQVAAPQAGAPDRAGGAQLRLGAAPDGDAGLAVAELHQAAAIEAVRRRRAAIAVPLADHLQRHARRPGRGCLLHPRRAIGRRRAGAGGEQQRDRRNQGSEARHEARIAASHEGRL